MKVRELLSGPEKWTKNAYARNIKGGITSEHSDGATCWCLIGAIYKCYESADERSAAFSKLHRSIGRAFDWNDAPERTFQEVKELVEELDI